MNTGHIDPRFWCNDKINGRIPGKRKGKALSWAARGVLMTVISWCADRKSDGKISERAARDVLRLPESLIDELISFGCFVPAPDIQGWMVHDYLEWNDSREEIEARAEAHRRRSAKYRESHKNIAGSGDAMSVSDASLMLTVAELTPNAAARAAQREAGNVIDIQAQRDAEKIGADWFFRLTTRTPDFISWRGEFARIGAKPEHERELVAKHYAATDYIQERPSKYNPDHLLKFWDDFVAGPRDMRKPLAWARPAPGAPSSKEAIESAAENNPDWVEAAQ